MRRALVRAAAWTPFLFANPMASASTQAPETCPRSTAAARDATPYRGLSFEGPYRHSLEVLLTSISEGFYGIDREGRCVFINRAGAEALGYEPLQLIGREMHTLIHRSHATAPQASQQCPIFRAVIGGESCRIDSEVLWRADGSCFPVEYSVCPIIDEGSITGAVVTFVDISDRKHAEALSRRVHDDLERCVDERTRELHHALGELNRTTDLLRELSAHVENACELDRKRIAREIHDELGSVLVALKLDLSWLRGRLGDRDDLVAKTGTMTGLIDKAVVEVGRIITDLRPSILDHQGLWAAMEWHALEFLETTGLDGQVRLEVNGRPPPGGALAIAAYRIFQEMLNNVARHAHARAVDIKVLADHERLTIVVSDDGRGITAQQRENRRSYGLIGMGERARHFGGELQIDASEHGGTCVTVRLPHTAVFEEAIHDSTADL